MLNPSTADAERDDPTIRACVRLARRWGFGSLVAVNLFALRATDPRMLRRARDPIGPENDAAIVGAAADADLLLAAWGNWGVLHDRGRAVLDLLRPLGRPHCLGLTARGQARHPLYVGSGTRVRPMA